MGVARLTANVATELDSSTVRGARLANQRLTGPRLRTPLDAVTWLGAVQAQDYTDAKWSLACRLRGATNESMEQALDRGQVLRTHVLRPTWHFVSPRDIRWMLRLTAPRVKARMAPYDRKLGITPTLVAKSNAAIARALAGGGHRTRQELKADLSAAGVRADAQRLAHLVMQAELDGLVCSGPRKGKHASYALMDERVPSAPEISRDEAIARLGQAYFTSHGPAQDRDFAWWSGLTMADAHAAIEANRGALRPATVGGRTFWGPAHVARRRPDAPTAFLLSIYDEYTIAYTDRSDMGRSSDVDRLLSMGAAFTAVLLLGGAIEGTWKRSFGRDHVEIRIASFRRLGADQREAVEAAAENYGAFFDVDARVRIERR